MEDKQEIPSIHIGSTNNTVTIDDIINNVYPTVLPIPVSQNDQFAHYDSLRHLRERIELLENQHMRQERILSLLVSTSDLNTGLLRMSTALDLHKIDHTLERDKIIVETGTIRFDYQMGYLFSRPGEKGGQIVDSTRELIETYVKNKQTA